MATEQKYFEENMVRLDQDWDDRMFRLTDGIQHRGRTCLAARFGENGHFTLVNAHPRENGLDPWNDDPVIVYRPIHPDVEVDDILTARHAWLVDGKWQFAACTPEEQAEYGALAEARVIAYYHPQVEQANRAVHGAADATAKTATLAIYDDLIEHRNDVWKVVDAKIREKPLGYFHANPEVEHIKDMVLEALPDVDSIWQGSETRRPRLARIATALKSVKDDLEKDRTILTPVQYRAAEEARKKAAEAQPAADPPAAAE